MLDSLSRLHTRYDRLVVQAALIAGALLVSIRIGQLVGIQGTAALSLPLKALFAIWLGYAILRQPFLGVVSLVASVPLQQVIPSVVGGVSALVFVGFITVAAGLLAWVDGRLPPLRWHWIHLLSGALVLWMAATARDLDFSLGTRQWLFTYIQLWLLLTMGSWLLRSEHHHRLLAWIFVMVTQVAIIWTMLSGEFAFGERLALLGRPSGTFGSANSQAVQIAVAFAFWLYLHQISHRRHVKVLLWSILPLMMLGFWAAVSRVGLIAVVVVFVLHLWRLRSRGKRVGWTLWLSIIAGLFVALVPSEYFELVLGNVLPAIKEGTGTIGIRYALWSTAIGMWQESPIWGVGVGQFMEVSAAPQWNLPLRFIGFAAHSSYLTLLAETGIVGCGLFLGWQVVALRRLLKYDTGWSRELNDCWLLILAVMTVVGVSGSTQYSKILWLAGGIAAYAPVSRYIAGRGGEHQGPFAP